MFDGIYKFLTELIKNLNPIDFLNLIWDLIQDGFYWLLQALVDFATLILSTISLPVFDVPDFSGGISGQVLAAMNWLLPFSFLSQIVGVIMASTFAYFTVGALLRWLRVVS